MRAWPGDWRKGWERQDSGASHTPAWQAHHHARTVSQMRPKGPSSSVPTKPHPTNSHCTMKHASWSRHIGPQHRGPRDTTTPPRGCPRPVLPSTPHHPRPRVGARSDPTHTTGHIHQAIPRPDPRAKEGPRPDQGMERGAGRGGKVEGGRAGRNGEGRRAPTQPTPGPGCKRAPLPRAQQVSSPDAPPALPHGPLRARGQGRSEERGWPHHMLRTLKSVESL